MDYMSFVYADSEAFWKSIFTLLTLCICDGLLFYFFTKSLPERSSKRWVSVLLFALFLGLYLLLYLQYYNVLRHSILFLLLLAGYLYSARKLAWTNSVFVASSFVLIVELACTIIKDGFLPELLRRLLHSNQAVWINIILLAFCIVLTTALIYFLQPIYRKYESIPLSVPKLLLLLLPFSLYLFVRFTKFHIMTSSYSDRSLLVYMQAAEILSCACAIAVTAVLANMVYAQQEVNRHLRMEMLLQNQQEQYKIKSESIAAVNRKYHDLKHIISGINAMNQAEASEFAARLEKEIQPFECVQETGHPMLNVLLSEKICECQEKKIRIIPYIDAAPLRFVNDLDLCSLFGNAIDNAIEATCQVPESHREVYIKIGRTDSMMVMRFQNSFDGQLLIRDGKLITGKKDPDEHGFGTENIRRIVEKYNGTSAFEAKEHVFTLNILIPIPDSAQTAPGNI